MTPDRQCSLHEFEQYRNQFVCKGGHGLPRGPPAGCWPPGLSVQFACDNPCSGGIAWGQGRGLWQPHRMPQSHRQTGTAAVQPENAWTMLKCHQHPDRGSEVQGRQSSRSGTILQTTQPPSPPNKLFHLQQESLVWLESAASATQGPFLGTQSMFAALSPGWYHNGPRKQGWPSGV